MNNPLRILHVVTYMGCGGLETMIMNYYRHIDRTKIQFDFLVHRKEPADYDDEILKLGGKIYRLKPLNPFDISYIKELNDFFGNHPEYNIVHSHLDCMSSIPLNAAKKAGIPIRIAHSHSSNQDKDYKYILKLYYKSMIAKNATKLFACSQSAGKWMFKNAQFDVLPNAIDAKKYSFSQMKRELVRKELNVENNYVIGHIGRFNPPKNHEFLIDIFNEIYRKEKKAKLLLVGVGNNILNIKAKVKRLGIENEVIFLGLRQDVEDILQAMDVFIFPSKYEGLGIVAIEAQASGLPCLISDKVPIECKKTALVHQIKLKEKVEVWANYAIDAMNITRENTYDKIKNAGYDINISANYLMDFYLKQNDLLKM